MALPPPVARRALRHIRSIKIDAFARDDGLWDIDAHITDIKTRDIKLADGVRPQGMPIHDLSLRLTINTEFTIMAVDAVSDAVPYAGFCNLIGPDYRQLVGLNLMQQFRHAVKQRMGGIQGCTHLTELAQMLPTAVIQAFAGDVLETGDIASAGHAGEKGEEEQMPFQLNRCHALRLDSGAVMKFYPRWATNPN
ncbi:MAG: DUF2889 domain-containing protein [Burkholderiaceae bacterium]|nr:DUF2889 domain-containing protein [Burkholderiaceae bacterium]